MDETTTTQDATEQSAAELFLDIADDFRMLIRKEIELVRIELFEGLRAQLIGAGIIVLALLGSLPGFLFAVFALTFWLPFSNEVSFAIMAGALLSFTLIGVIAGLWIMRRRRIRLDRSIESIKEDVKWAREQLRS